MQRMPLLSGEQEVRIVRKREPVFAAIDPHINFIDHNSNDNILRVKVSSDRYGTH